LRRLLFEKGCPGLCETPGLVDLTECSKLADDVVVKIGPIVGQDGLRRVLGQACAEAHERARDGALRGICGHLLHAVNRSAHNVGQRRSRRQRGGSFGAEVRTLAPALRVAQSTYERVDDERSLGPGCGRLVETQPVRGDGADDIPLRAREVSSLS
jgi:hypothetical protein